MVSVVCCRRSDFWHCWFSVWPPLLLRTVCRGIAWRATGWAAVPTITPWPYSPLSSVSSVCCHSADIALYWKKTTKRTNISLLAIYLSWGQLQYCNVLVNEEGDNSSVDTDLYMKWLDCILSHLMITPSLSPENIRIGTFLAIGDKIM